MNLEEIQKELEEVKVKLKEQESVTSLLNNYLAISDLKLNALQSIITVATSSLEFDKVLDELMDIIIETMKVDAGSLLLINEDNMLEFKVAKGEKKKEIMEYKLKLGDGVAGWVAREGKPKILPEVDSEAKIKEDISMEIDYKVSNILCVPMKIKDKVIGVIEILNKIDRRRFIKDDLDLLISIAGEVALVIENAKLHF